MTSDAYRLPGTVRPRHYDLEITADPDEPTFEGTATIWLSTDEPTRTLEMHARDLKITHVVVKEGNTRYHGKATLDEETETVELTFPEPVPAGNARLILEYTGQVGQAMSGLYLSESGDERCLVTQCEATDARAVFPCFDEPAYKAPIRWTITAPSEHTVLANGALDEKTDNEDGTSTWRFKATPKIPSYLAAMAVGQFEPTPEARRNKVPFRVWALAGKERLGEHARDFAVELLPWYETYFDVEYPFKKYDQLAVPSFSFGAMENVGLVVFRDSLLLMDEDSASWRQVKAIDRVVSHEFAHMWFGNLVTMAWWDDLWLNEAFAEWIAHKSVDELEPTHQVWHDFADRTTSALETDALASTHAIYHPVETPEEAMEMFDAITYGKGSAVMRMLEAYLREDGFREGLRTYMDAFAQRNAEGADLWEHLAKANDEPVDEIMASWIEQPGHPVLDVRLDGDSLVVEQTRATASPTTDVDDRTWQIPLVVRYEDVSGTDTDRALLEGDTARLPLDADGEIAWVFPNADAMGFYRTRVSDEMLDALEAHLDRLDPTEKTALIRDEWANVKAGDRDVDRFLALFDALATAEDHYAVVEAAVDQLAGLETLLDAHGTDPALDGLRAFAAERFGEALPDPVEPGEAAEPSEGQRLAAVLKAAAAIGQADDAKQTALDLAAREQDAPESVDPNLAGTAVAIRARFGDADTFAEHLDLYETRRDAHRPPQEVDRYLHSFASFRDADVVDRVIQLLDDGTVPKQDVGPLLAGMLTRPHSQDAAWDYVTSHYEALLGRVGPSWISRIVEASSQLDPADRDEILAFWEANLDGIAQEALKRTRERLDNRAELVDRVLDDVEAWATQHA